MEPLHRKLKLILYKKNDFEIKNRILVPRGKIRRIYRISRNVEPKKSKKIRNCEQLYNSPRHFLCQIPFSATVRQKKMTLRKIRYAVFGSLAVQFSGRAGRGEGRGRSANATTKNVRAMKREREREREVANRYGFHSRRRMGV